MDVKQYREAAESGDASAQDRLGIMYANGEGVPKDEQQAAFWFRKAAEQGNEHAQFMLALWYAQGIGVAQDEEQSLFWIRKLVGDGADAALKTKNMIKALELARISRP